MEVTLLVEATSTEGKPPGLYVHLSAGTQFYEAWLSNVDFGGSVSISEALAWAYDKLSAKYTATPFAYDATRGVFVSEVTATGISKAQIAADVHDWGVNEQFGPVIKSMVVDLPTNTLTLRDAGGATIASYPLTA